MLTSRIEHMTAVESDRQWIDKIPYIQWPYGWKVKAVPPHTFAVVRYHVINKHGAKISIYLDCYEALGCFGSPYWEIYPNKDDETERFAMADTDSMIEAIRKIK